MGARSFRPFAIASFALHAAVFTAFYDHRTTNHVGTVAGDTFALPEPVETEGVSISELAEPAPSLPSSPSPEESPPTANVPTESVSKRSVRTTAKPANSIGAASSAGASAPSPETELYGAVGDRSATDIALAFTSQFPSAASADPLWNSAPFGSAGEVRIALTIDENGRLIDTALRSGGSPALRSGVQRTLALIRGRAFTAHQATTTLAVAGKVSPDEVHDGLHGDFFAVGRSSHEGTAFFALPIGRRIDIRVQTK